MHILYCTFFLKLHIAPWSEKTHGIKETPKSGQTHTRLLHLTGEAELFQPVRAHVSVVFFMRRSGAKMVAVWSNLTPPAECSPILKDFKAGWSQISEAPKNKCFDV